MLAQFAGFGLGVGVVCCVAACPCRAGGDAGPAAASVMSASSAHGVARSSGASSCWSASRPKGDVRAVVGSVVGHCVRGEVAVTVCGGWCRIGCGFICGASCSSAEVRGRLGSGSVS